MNRQEMENELRKKVEELNNKQEVLYAERKQYMKNNLDYDDNEWEKRYEAITARKKQLQAVLDDFTYLEYRMQDMFRAVCHEERNNDDVRREVARAYVNIHNNAMMRWL